MGLKLCKDCGAEISKGAKVCPKCGKEQRNFFQKHIIISFILILIILGAVGSVMNGGNTSKDKTTKTDSDTDLSITQDSEIITLEEFNQIQTGMAYQEVVNIIGSEGVLNSEVSVGDEQYDTQLYTWYGSGLGANANISFQGGKVISKAQIGLK